MNDDKNCLVSNLDYIRIICVGTESSIKNLKKMTKKASQGDRNYLNLAVENLNNAVKWLKKIEICGTLK